MVIQQQMGPPQPQVEEGRKEFIEGKAEEVVKAMEGARISDIGPIFNAAQNIITEKTTIG